MRPGIAAGFQGNRQRHPWIAVEAGHVVDVLAFRQLRPRDDDPSGLQFLGQSRRRAVARLVVVVAEDDPLGLHILDQGPMRRREAVDAICTRDVAEARAPQGQSINDGFAQEPFLLPAAGPQRRRVPHRPMLAGQVQVQRRPLPQGPRDLAGVHLRHVAVLVEDRDDHRAAEVLVAAHADDAEPLQLLLEPPARRRRPRHAIAEGAVGVADLEELHRLGVEAAPLLQVAHRLQVVAGRSGGKSRGRA